MSFQARSTLVSVLIYLGIYGWYFRRVFAAIQADPVDAIDYQPLLLVMVGVLVALGVATHIVLAVVSPRDADRSDERDRLIELRGQQKGSHVLSVFALGALALAMIESEPFWIAHALLGGMVLAEVVKGTFKLLDYRRGV